MIKLFRNIRQNLLAEGKTTNYLKYAVGEIILVVIGILIALSINNWNEKRKLQTTLNNTLKEIGYDLEIDTTYATHIINFYESNQKNSKKILKNEITKDNYNECLECMNLVTIYQPFTIQSKGIGQLKNIISNQSPQKDSLTTEITKFYSIYNPLINKSNDRMEAIVMKNFNDFQEFPWFVDMTMGNITEDIILYYTESDDYKKRVASHAILAVGNHLGLAKQYKKDATELLGLINKRLKKE
jgi:hypothetical protein